MPNLQKSHAFGMEMPGRSIGSDFAYNFNGKRTDKWNGDNGSYLDFGARMLDTRLGRWMGRDPHETRYASMSPYNFVLNSPICLIDPDGKDVYFVVWNDNFQNAAMQRKSEIEKMEGFDKTKDHVYVIHAEDLGKLNDEVAASLVDAKKMGYGKTAEAAFYTHASYDGPVGDVKASKFDLSDDTKDDLDEGQMQVYGWQQIEWNFDPQYSIASFYGCRSSEFAFKFALFTDVRIAAGNGEGTADSKSPHYYESKWGPGEGNFQISKDGSGLLLYVKETAGQKYKINFDDPTEWNFQIQARLRANLEIYTSFSTNLGVNIDKLRKRSYKGYVHQGDGKFQSKNKSKTFKSKLRSKF